MPDRLAERLAELETDPVVFRDSPFPGARENLRWITLADAKGAGFSADALARFLDSACQVRKRQAANAGVSSALFYAWHDEMAGQLRFSIADCAQGGLPFGVQVLKVSEPRSIIKTFLSGHDGTIAWADLATEAGVEAGAAASGAPLFVWVA